MAIRTYIHMYVHFALQLSPHTVAIDIVRLGYSVDILYYMYVTLYITIMLVEHLPHLSWALAT